MNKIECSIVSFKDGLKGIDTIKNQHDSTIYQTPVFLNLYFQSQYLRFVSVKPEMPILNKDFFFVKIKAGGGKTCCLCPCEYDKMTNTLSLAGDWKQINLPIYDVDSFTYHCFLSLIDFLKKCRPCKQLYFQQIDQETLFYQYLSEYCSSLKEEEKKIKISKCVSVNDINSEYDKWYSNLSKSVRQNIRTSYNHLKSDGKQPILTYCEKG